MSLHLKLFGGLSLVDAATGRVLVTRRHRLAALAILATADGPVPRERLLALLWPDSSAESGRHALGQVLYGLRQDLGVVELVGGASDLTLQRTAFACDLWTFRQSLAAGDAHAALAAYAGPFLDGVHLAGADPFDRWCDEERTVLARQARDAMQSLATAAEARDDPADAVRWWRQLAAADPMSSRVALSLMRALAASGDRAAAVQHARVHAALVQSELEVAADPAVFAYAEELRAAPPPPAIVAAAPALGPTEPPAPDPSPVDVPDVPRRPRPRAITFATIGIVALATLAALAALAAGARFLVARAPPARDDGGVPVAAVLPFDVRGDTTRAFLGEALSALLATRLDAPGVLRTLESNAVLSALGTHDAARGDDADARVVALGAGVLVHGTVVVLRDHLEIDAELRARDGGARVARASVSGSVDSLFALADHLGAALLVAREGRPLGSSALGGTVSVPALKALLSGERALRSWQLANAASAYRDAVQIDSTYAMAWYRLSFVQGWSHDGDGGVAAQARAVRLAAGLPARQALLLAAVVARTHGDYAAGERGLITLVQRYPDDADPWAELGEFRMHVGPLMGQPTTDAEAPLARALALDSAGHPEVRYHLAQLALERGDAVRARALAAPILATRDRGDRTLSLQRVMFTLDDGGASEMASLLHELRAVSANDAWFTMTIGIVSSGITPRARAMAESLAATPASGDHRVVGLSILQQMAVADRRWADVMRIGATLAALDSVSAANAWGAIAVALDASVPPDTWRRAGDVLERAARSDTSRAGWEHRYLAALLAVRAGDDAAYARRLTVLGDRPHPSPAFTANLHVLRALHADAARDTVTADHELDAIGPAMDAPLGRWLRARSLERAGQPAIAAQWYLSTPWGPNGIVLTRSALEHAAALSGRSNAPALLGRAAHFVGGR